MSHLLHSSRSLSLVGCTGALLTLLVSSCTTGQIGGEIEHTDNGGEASGESCEEVVSQAIELDEETVIGVSARELIDAITGVHQTTLSWGGDLEEGDYELTPDSGETTITVEVIPRPETAVFVDLEVEESDGEDGRVLIDEPGGNQCTDEVRVTADVVITSANGAFDDTFEATFSTKTGSVASTRINIVPGELAGSFDIASTAGGEPVQTAISLSFSFGTLSGTVSGIWQQVHGDPDDPDSLVSGALMTYARFPADGCEWGTLVTEESPWGAAIFEAVEAATAFELTWQNGDTTGLAVETTIAKLCLEASAYESGGTIAGDAVSIVSTEDGLVNATWEAEVRAWVEGDAITSVSVTSVESEYQATDAASFAEQSGISGIETDATDLAFEFTYSLGPSDETASGTLTVFELLVPDCARPDYEPEIEESPDGGSGSPGCMGIDYVELETATFRESGAD